MNKQNNVISNATVNAEKVAFKKSKILQMERYKDRIDLLSVLLDDKKSYTHEQIEMIIQNFMKGKVK